MTRSEFSRASSDKVELSSFKILTTTFSNPQKCLNKVSTHSTPFLILPSIVLTFLSISTAKIKVGILGATGSSLLPFLLLLLLDLPPSLFLSLTPFPPSLLAYYRNRWTTVHHPPRWSPLLRDRCSRSFLSFRWTTLPQGRQVEADHSHPCLREADRRSRVCS